MLLGDLGADVVKVERPGGGDQSRSWGPPFLGSESACFLAGTRDWSIAPFQATGLPDRRWGCRGTTSSPRRKPVCGALRENQTLSRFAILLLLPTSRVDFIPPWASWPRCWQEKNPAAGSSSTWHCLTASSLG